MLAVSSTQWGSKYSHLMGSLRESNELIFASVVWNSKSVASSKLHLALKSLKDCIERRLAGECLSGNRWGDIFREHNYNELTEFAPMAKISPNPRNCNENISSSMY